MNAKDFKKAVELVVKEKGISEDVIYDAMELALTAAYKKNYNSLPNVRVDINRETGDIKVYSFKTVRKEDETDEEGNLIFNAQIDLTLEEARLIVPGIEYGETIEEEVTPHDFGRVAAATAKQVVIQKIREAERNVIIEAYADKKDEMLSGIANMEDENNYYIDLGKTQGILPKSECIPGEKIKMGSNIKVYVTKVENNTKGPLTVLNTLNILTNNWSNVDYIENYEYNNSGTGYKKLSIVDGNAIITDSSGGNVEVSGKARARLLTYEEAKALGCSTSSGSCPSWLYKNLNAEYNSLTPYGYWLLTSYGNGRAYNVRNTGLIANNSTSDSTGRGIRPVITIKKYAS